MYTKNLIASRGTDNQILIEFVNQDQKAVPITGMEFTCRIIDSTGEILLLEKPLEAVNEARGQAKLVLTEDDLNDIHPQYAHFSVERVETGRPYEPVYVDDYAGIRGNIDIVDAIMPRFVESATLTIPDGQPADNYVSSEIETDHQPLMTFEITYENDFTGDVVIEGNTEVDNHWYTINSESLTNTNGPAIVSITGHHPYVRISFNNVTQGAVARILYR